MNWFWKVGNKLYHKKWSFIGKLFYIINIILFSNQISYKAIIGKDTRFLHHGIGCVVHPNAVIGDKCTIFQNVTIGSKWSRGLRKGGAAVIGCNVLVGAGAVILGNVSIGNNTCIGANAVVLTDVPDNAIATGVPARISLNENKSI